MKARRQETYSHENLFVLHLVVVSSTPMVAGLTCSDPAGSLAAASGLRADELPMRRTWRSAGAPRLRLPVGVAIEMLSWFK